MTYFQKALDLAMKEAYRFFPGFDHALHREIANKKAADWKELKAQKHRFKEAEAFEMSLKSSDYADEDLTELNEGSSPKNSKMKATTASSPQQQSPASEGSSPQPVASTPIKTLPTPLTRVHPKPVSVMITQPSIKVDSVSLDTMNPELQQVAPPLSKLQTDRNSGRHERRRRKPGMGHMESVISSTVSPAISTVVGREVVIGRNLSPPLRVVAASPGSDSSEGTAGGEQEAKLKEGGSGLGFEEESIRTSDIL
jgi:hypothetical protein